jgi:hypothetical protein
MGRKNAIADEGLSIPPWLSAICTLFVATGEFRRRKKWSSLFETKSLNVPFPLHSIFLKSGNFKIIIEKSLT